MGEFGRDVPAQCRKPAQLVLELVRAHRLSVRYVDVDDAYAANRRREHALLLVLEAGDAGDHVPQRLFRKDRHAVVGALPAERHVQSQRLDLVLREVRVGELRLLQRDRVHGIGREPVPEVRQADAQRVDVPVASSMEVISD